VKWRATTQEHVQAEFFDADEKVVPIEACIANARRATNGSPVPLVFTSEFPNIRCAGINKRQISYILRLQHALIAQSELPFSSAVVIGPDHSGLYGMAHHNVNSSNDKISEPFRSRLSKLGREERIRAIVLLRTPQRGERSGRRQSREERKAAIFANQSATAAAFEEIEAILEPFGGKRLTDKPNALGYIPIETTRDGLIAVAESDAVRAILEDQPISLLK
jgi:hypothetical protein